MKYFFVAVLIHACILGHSQDTLRITTAVPRHAIRISPLHLASFYSTIQVGYETLLFKNITLYGEGGVVVNLGESGMSTGLDEYANKRGYKAKLEPRLYFYENFRNTITFYAATEFYFNKVDFDRSENIVECFDVDCAHSFQRRYTYEVEYREKGFAPKIGIMFYIRNFFFDVNSGLAIRDINYHKPNVPEQVTFDDEWSIDLFVPIEETRVVPGLVLGFRLGYRFK